MVDQLRPLGRVAVPGVDVQRDPRQQVQRHHHDLVRHDLPRRGRARQAVLEPGELGGAEQRAPLPAHLRRQAQVQQVRSTAGLLVPVLAGVEQEHLRGAEVHRAVDAVGLVRPAGARHVLEEGAVRVGAALEEGDAPVAGGLAGLAVAVVVLDLVVVPDRGDRVAGADRLQVRVRVVERVLAPVLLEGLRLAALGGVVGPHRGVLVARRDVGALVDVVAQAHHQVDVVAGRQVGVRGVEAGHPVLAREERDPDRLAGVGRARGAEAADGRVDLAGGEAVPVLLAGQQARVVQADVRRPAGLRARRRRAPPAPPTRTRRRGPPPGSGRRAPPARPGASRG